MKSLEIIDDLLFDFLDDAIDESATFISKSEIEQIKVDLEVLEILRKYIPKNWNGFQICTSKEETKIEDLKKVKQWLEENEWWENMIILVLLMAKKH